MSPDVPMMVPISEADKDFSRVMRVADSYGRVVILKDNKPKYLLIDLEQETLIYDLTEEKNWKSPPSEFWNSISLPLRNLPNNHVGDISYQ